MNWLVAAPAGLASAVEFVEAYTIVLAVGITRGWRSALLGTLAAVLVLAALVLVLGVAVLRLVPLDALRAIIGIFLLLFGLRWLRKAILRYAGIVPLHDEEQAFSAEVEELSRGGAGRRAAGWDWLASLTSFNGVLIEGLEVVFIVVALGSAARAIGSAALGAGVAALLVLAAGLALRHPLERVPENTFKFVVGIMLTSFGTFWTAEGLGVSWWRGDLSLVPLIAAYLALAWAFVIALRSTRQKVRAHPNA